MSEKASWQPSDESIKGAFERWYSITLATGPDERDSPELAPIRALITTAVEKALAEQGARHTDEIETLNLEITARDGIVLDMKARHAREIERAGLEAKIETLRDYGTCTCPDEPDGCDVCEAIGYARAELAALESKGGEG